MTKILLALALIGVAAGPALAADQPVEVGRVLIIDGCEAFVIAAFPSGQRLVYVGKFDLWHYKEGDEIRVDAAGRPQPPP
jgi:hypothetical protein